MTRSGRLRGFLPLASLLCALVPGTAARAGGAAHAGGVADGEAGLQAFDRGSYDEAIRLLSKALKAKGISSDDREFAYLLRGKAYLKQNDATDALADLRQAVSPKPGDPDAQSALKEALAGQATPPSDQAAPPLRAGDHWGMLAAMVGRYYVSGQEPNKKVLHVEWATPQQTLTGTVRSKAGLAEISETQFDEAAGSLLSVDVIGIHHKNIALYCTEDASGSTVTSYCFIGITPIKLSLALMADGSVIQHTQAFKDGMWHGDPDRLFVEVPRETVEALGLLK